MSKINLETEGIRYSGSKKEILNRIINLIPNEVNGVLDGFTGTTRVAQALKKSNFNVDTNDVAIYSEVFSNCYIKNNIGISHFNEMITHLNNVKPLHGYFSEYYGGCGETSIQKDGKKRNWQIHNTMKLDAVREEIEHMGVSYIEKCVLLTSLILAMDKVSNNLGHQVAYLKDWSGRSYEKMLLLPPKLISGNKDYNVFRDDISNIDKEYDLVYLDPPYGTNNQVTKTTRVRYASYYHLWTTICKNDKPEVVGAANRRLDVSSDTLPGAINDYEHIKYEHVYNTVNNLINKLKTKYIIFSYNNKSKLKIEDLRSIFNSNGNKLIKEESFEHKENVQKILTSNKEWMGDTSKNLEYLFLISKG